MVLKGGPHHFDEYEGFRSVTASTPLVITWDEPIDISYVKFRLWDLDERYYTYSFECQHADGSWHCVGEIEEGWSWQHFALLTMEEGEGASTRVAALRWTGTNSEDSSFDLVEIEAI